MAATSRACPRAKPAAGLATAGPHVDDVVGVGDDVQVVLDDDDGGALLHEPLRTRPGVCARRAGADRWWARRTRTRRRPAPRPHLAGELQALRLAAGKRRRGLAQREVAQAQQICMQRVCRWAARTRLDGRARLGQRSVAASNRVAACGHGSLGAAALSGVGGVDGARGRPDGVGRPP